MTERLNYFEVMTEKFIKNNIQLPYLKKIDIKNTIKIGDIVKSFELPTIKTFLSPNGKIVISYNRSVGGIFITAPEINSYSSILDKYKHNLVDKYNEDQKIILLEIFNLYREEKTENKIINKLNEEFNVVKLVEDL